MKLIYEYCKEVPATKEAFQHLNSGWYLTAILDDNNKSLGLSYNGLYIGDHISLNPDVMAAIVPTTSLKHNVIDTN